jgi:RNA-directed DNA polymerase
MTEIIKKIANELLLPFTDVQQTVKFAPQRVKRFKIKKRSGGYREIIQPAGTLKPILSWIDTSLLAKLPVHSIATAFRPGKSILDNATIHSGSKYSVRVDISGFFPSIRNIDIALVIKSEKNNLPSWACTPGTLDLISKVCFDTNGALPIGYSTSPSIANAVMFRIDSELTEEISKTIDFGKAVVTRYADDFVFSSDKAGACKTFVQTLEKILASTKSPALSINTAKTRFMSRGGGSTLITGLRVNNQGNVVVHANYRDHVRLLLKLYRSSSLKADDVPKLVGHLAYVQHVDPAFFTKLSFKFHSDISRIRGLTNTH